MRVVSLLGNVDAGKTTIMRQILGFETQAERQGRTQSIFAYHKPGLTFVDLPGHDVFAIDREWGLALSDVVCLVWNPGDRTTEVLDAYAAELRSAGKPLVVCVTRSDVTNSEDQVEGAGYLQARLEHHGLSPEEVFFLPRESAAFVDYIVSVPLASENPYWGLICGVNVMKGKGRGNEVLVVRPELMSTDTTVVHSARVTSKGLMENRRTFGHGTTYWVRFAGGNRQLGPVGVGVHEGTTIRSEETCDTYLSLTAETDIQRDNVKRYVAAFAKEINVKVCWLESPELSVPSFHFAPEGQGTNVYDLVSSIKRELLSVVKKRLPVSGRIRVERVFERVKVGKTQRRVLGFSTVSSQALFCGSYLFIGDNYFRVEEITSGSKPVTDGAHRGKLKYACLLSRDDWVASRDEEITFVSREDAGCDLPGLTFMTAGG